MHMRSLKELREVEVVAACDVRVNQLTKALRKWKIPQGFTRYEDMLKSLKAEAVLILTPPDQHFPLALKALNHGLHVICEKPLSQSLDEAKRLIDRALKTGLHLLPVYNYAFTPSLLRLTDWIKRGELGDVRGVKAFLGVNLSVFKPKTPYLLNSDEDIIWDLLPHVVSVLRMLPVRVEGVLGVKTRRKRYRVVDEVEVGLKLKEGLAQIKLSWISLIPSFSLSLNCDHGGVEVEVFRKPYELILKRGGVKRKVKLPGKPSFLLFRMIRLWHPSFGNMYKHFAQVVDEGEKPFISPESILEDLKVVYEAARLVHGAG